MAVRIRLKRMGRRHRPFYRISVMDAQTQRDGRSIEDVGHYDPMVPDKSQRVKVDLDRIDHWLSVGAKPTEKVAVLIKKVRSNKFGEANAPPPMTPPKEPPAEAKADESAPADTESGQEEASSEDAAGETAESKTADAD